MFFSGLDISGAGSDSFAIGVVFSRSGCCFVEFLFRGFGKGDVLFVEGEGRFAESGF